VFRQNAQQQSLLLRALLFDHQLSLQALPGLQKRTALLELRQVIAAGTQNRGADEQRHHQDLQDVFYEANFTSV